MIKVKDYSVISSGHRQLYVGVPPAFARAHSLKKGSMVYVYMTSKHPDWIIISSSLLDLSTKTRIFVNAYKLHPVGTQSLRVKIPPIYRDTIGVEKGDRLSAFLTNDQELIYYHQEKEHE